MRSTSYYELGIALPNSASAQHAVASLSDISTDVSRLRQVTLITSDFHVSLLPFDAAP